MNQEPEATTLQSAISIPSDDTTSGGMLDPVPVERGRGAPCLCQSGRKHKNCCLFTRKRWETPQARYKRLRKATVRFLASRGYTTR